VALVPTLMSTNPSTLPNDRSFRNFSRKCVLTRRKTSVLVTSSKKQSKLLISTTATWKTHRHGTLIPTRRNKWRSNCCRQRQRSNQTRIRTSRFSTSKSLKKRGKSTKRTLRPSSKKLKCSNHSLLKIKSLLIAKRAFWNKKQILKSSTSRKSVRAWSVSMRLNLRKSKTSRNWQRKWTSKLRRLRQIWWHWTMSSYRLRRGWLFCRTTSSQLSSITSQKTRSNSCKRMTKWPNKSKFSSAIFRFISRSKSSSPNVPTRPKKWSLAWKVRLNNSKGRKIAWLNRDRAQIKAPGRIVARTI